MSALMKLSIPIFMSMTTMGKSNNRPQPESNKEGTRAAMREDSEGSEDNINAESFMQLHESV